MRGKIFDIQRFCIHDGPGIRTVVFFKGCNMRCQWCHNPESHKSREELMFFREKCTGCGRCREFCSKAFTDSCTRCGRCAAVCRSGARELTGRSMTVEEVFDTVVRDREYYLTSGGGVTVSGGEPLLQAEFVHALFTKCRENGISTAMETAGNVPWEVLERFVSVTDLFLYDIKGMDRERHRKNTGVFNDLILENAKKLMGTGAGIRFRMPVIPGWNEDEKPAVEAFTEGFALEFLPYHDMGKGKYEALGIPYRVTTYSKMSFSLN